ncbi:MAG: hypothetical protein J6M59_02015 [Bacteroidaceae bacterium]|nr:hypothetical protein [Bacteroidaceae bacterium]
MDYIVSIIFVLIFATWEWKQYNKVRKLTALYRNIFPNSTDQLEFDSQKLCIISTHDSDLFKNIVRTINRYLGENSDQVSDYHLMKDVVDRNREVAESEIETLIPFTQYIGLVGTMFGIFFGVFVLVFVHGLDNLMSGSITALASSGVTELLGGVAIAVLTSALGLCLTMRSSSLFKDAKRIVELRENAFLGWIQAEMLPNLSTDMTSTLVKMTNNLRDFNKTFSSNTEKLDHTLAKVNDSYKGQARILEVLERVDVKNVAMANVQVYEKLKDCTNEIGMIGDALKSSRLYLQQVRELTERLDKMDERAKTWEKMAKFFEMEINEIERRKAAISEAVGNVDEKLKQSFEHLGQTAKAKSDEVAEKIIDENSKLDNALSQQEELLNRKLGEMSDAIDKRNRKLSDVFASLEQLTKTLPAEMQRYTHELSNLSDIKRGIADLEKAIIQSANSRVVTKEGVVVTSPSTKIPLMLKIAIYIIALYSFIMMVKEMYLVVTDFIVK